MIYNLNLNSNIIIYCAKGYGESIALKLISAGYHITAFCDNAPNNEGKFILGIPVYNYKICQKNYSDILYIVANSTYAKSIEIGLELEQDGYIRDVTYYLANDLELQGILPDEWEGVKLILNSNTLILFGNMFLCHIFEKWAMYFLDNFNLYICSNENKIEYYRETYKNAIWIPLEKTFPLPDSNINESLVQILQSYNINSFTRFFLSHLIYCEEYQYNMEKIKFDIFPGIKKVVFLKSSGFSGSALINSMFDFHPNILYLGFNLWSINIWYIFKSATMVKSGIPKVIIESIKECLKDTKYNETGSIESKGNLEWLEKYYKILTKYFKDGKIYTNREIFILIHIAYYEFLHGVQPQEENMIIYMDIHSNMIMESSIFSCLEQMGFEIILLEMIRNPIKRLGSCIKYSLGEHIINSIGILNNIDWMFGEYFDRSEKIYQIIRIRFEDIKLYPKQITEKLCKILKIPWNDALLKTTISGEDYIYVTNGETITSFNLKPVYYSYDEYFDEFDKLRLSLIFREKNKAYGYSYLNNNKINRLGLEMDKIFKIPFRFENYITFKDEYDRKSFRYRLQILSEHILYLENNMNKYKECFQFGEYLMVKD